MQQSFYRTQTSGGTYEWKKYDGTRYTYYVANPRFLSYVQNENALNYGDSGYSKYDDEGVIILQSRTNYGKISYKTEIDLLGSVLRFTGEQVLDAIVGELDKITGGVAGIIQDSIEFGIDLYRQMQSCLFG